MSKPKRLTGLGQMNYRNIGLGFSVSVLMEMGKELDDNCKQFRLIGTAEKALVEVLNGLPDQMTEEQVKQSTVIFFEMEKHILKDKEYAKYLAPLELEELYELVNPTYFEENNDGAEY